MAQKKTASVAPLKLDHQLCFAIYSTAHAFGRVYKPLLDALGLTYPQYLVMLALWERDHVPLKDIGERLFLDSGTLTPLLKRLETSGYLTRERSALDERQVIIALTRQGQALQKKATLVPKEILQATQCSVTELGGMREALTRLRDQLNTITEGC